MTVFYLGPVALAAWYGGTANGWLIGVASAAAWLAGDLALNNHSHNLTMPYWNAAMMILIYGVVVQLLSALQRVQIALRKRVEQRTVSLAEVHHRVKNNLQIISSLLLLKADKLANPADKAVFAECRDRICFMARLHEQLYASGRFKDLDFAANLRELAEMLVRSHTPPDCALVFEVEADQVPMDLDSAVTLGLIANELILNALKHGFAGRRTGNLTVSLHAGVRNQMTVRDNGRGLRPGFDARKNGKLGIELVFGMTRQIRGEARIGNDPAGGTRATILFPSARGNFRNRAGSIRHD
jgi:two-component sensor histidine kinase